MAKKAKAKISTLSGAKLGHWIFLAGIIIAIVTALIIDPTSNGAKTVVWVLALLGLIVGLINVTLKDEVPFLVATTVLLLASGTFVASLNYLPLVVAPAVTKLTSMLVYITFFVAPAGLIVALKAIYAFARE